MDRQILRVCLDPGHGGADPGAVNRELDLRESDVNLYVCLKLRELLQERQQIEVYFTRQWDVAISLTERVWVSNSVGAHAFVSVHCNAARRAIARGAQIFVSQFASEAAQNLARRIASGLGHYAKLDFWHRLLFLRDVAHLGHSLYVLRRTLAPAVLVELGFLTNAGDARSLARKERLDVIADALRRSILNWAFPAAWPPRAQPEAKPPGA